VSGMVFIDRSRPKEKVEKIRYAIRRGRLYGSEGWVSKAVAQFGLENMMRNRGRTGKGAWHHFPIIVKLEVGERRSACAPHGPRPTTTWE